MTTRAVPLAALLMSLAVVAPAYVPPPPGYLAVIRNVSESDELVNLG